MSIFAKPLSQLTWPDVEELLTGNAVENVRLEFKRDKPGRDEILKKLSSFANTYGGQLVVGAEANSKDGRLMGLPGIPLENNYKQTIVQWCADGVTPFVDVDVSDAIPHPANGTVLYVMRVSESDLAPHFLNERKGIYVRTNEFSSRFEPRLADESELRHLFNRRQVVNDRRLALIERARRRFATLVTRQHKEKKIGSRFDLAIIPRFPAQQICDHALLNSVIRKELITWRQTSFPRSSSRHISQHESAIVSNPGHSFSMIEANVWGLLFYATEVSRETSGGLTGIHLIGIASHGLMRCAR
jgi:hypothetical protein